MAEAFAAVRRSPLAIFAASALAIMPAHLLAGAVDYVGARGITAETPPTRSEQVRSRRAELADGAGPASPEANTAEQREVLRQASGPPPPTQPLRLRFGRGITQAIAIGILFAGLLLAQAAIVPLAFGQGGAAAAWAAVGARFGSVCAAAFAGAALVAVGILCLVVPGIVIAIVFFFAAPAAVSEPNGGVAGARPAVRGVRRGSPGVVALPLLTARADGRRQQLDFL